MHVATVQKLPLSTVGAPLQIRCKTFLSVTFVLPRERECHDLYTSLMQMSQPCKIILTDLLVSREPEMTLFICLSLPNYSPYRRSLLFPLHVEPGRDPADGRLELF